MYRAEQFRGALRLALTLALGDSVPIVLGTKLGQDLVHMILDRSFGVSQFARDFLIA